MKLEIPKMVEKLALREYAEAFGEEGIWVWVNPPRDVLRIHDDKFLQKKATEEEIYAWYAEIWSQGPDGTQWTVEEVAELWQRAADTDPRLWAWLAMRTREMIREHREKKKVII